MTAAENLRRKSAVEKCTTEPAVLIGGTRYDSPMRKGTLGPDVVDISTLYQDTGCFTYDPGFTSTASCESKITFTYSSSASVSKAETQATLLPLHCK
jgi:hypothetical protein